MAKPKYECTTETGSVYVLDYDGNVLTKNGRVDGVFWYVKSFPSIPNRDPNFHAKINQAPEVEFPVVGERMYIAGRGWSYWITTDIVKVVKR